MSQNTSIVKADDINQAVWGTLINSVFPGANENSVMMAVQYCEARGLDVLKKPVHIVPMSVKNAQTNQYEWRDIIMPGISELRTTASRSSTYGGQSAPDFGEVKKFKIGSVEIETPESCTVTVFKLINGQQVGFSHTEFFVEACSTTKDGTLNSMWKKRPRGQLSKCAEAGALRKAFPEDLGGEISFDEVLDGANDANGNNVISIDPIKEETTKSLLKGLSLIGDSVESLLETENVESINDLSEQRAGEILTATRAKFRSMDKEQKPDIDMSSAAKPQANEQSVNY